MTFVIVTLLPSLGLLAGMLVCIELGRFVGARRKAAAGNPRVDAEEVAIDGAIFALFGLIIAFTFSGAMNRFDRRRDQIVSEANAIGTAYLRIALLPAEAQAPLRKLFREYVSSRLATYRKLPDIAAANAEYQRSLGFQNDIWSKAVASAATTGNPAVPQLVLPALNEMFDIATERLVATRTHVPGVILLLLFGLALAVGLVVGYATADSPRNWFRSVVFSAAIAASVYIVLDLEHPRFGVIRIDGADQILDEVLAQMQ
jgi:hypothetical protein